MITPTGTNSHLGQRKATVEDSQGNPSPVEQRDGLGPPDRAPGGECRAEGVADAEGPGGGA